MYTLWEELQFVLWLAAAISLSDHPLSFLLQPDIFLRRSTRLWNKGRKSANHKIRNLADFPNLLDFQAVNKCGDLRTRSFLWFADLRFILKGDFLDFSFYVRYSTLLHLPPLRFHCVGVCWDRTQKWHRLDLIHLQFMDFLKNIIFLLTCTVGLKSSDSNVYRKISQRNFSWFCNEMAYKVPSFRKRGVSSSQSFGEKFANLRLLTYWNI